ncbi:MAG: hypothetical protein HRU06_07275 [Oceanospirillaceae bacterium]|nr:hypothetical protein [Oceanospirillaceae bacterium]
MEGEIFHVTPKVSFDSIVANGEIRPNTNNQYVGAFGKHSGSYCRVRKFISLFDYHNASIAEIEYAENKCLPTMSLTKENSLVVLFLSQSIWSKVLPYSRKNFEENLSQMVVPHIEAGYPEPISMKQISKILILSTNDDEDSLVKALRAGRQKYAL